MSIAPDTAADPGGSVRIGVDAFHAEAQTARQFPRQRFLSPAHQFGKSAGILPDNRKTGDSGETGDRERFMHNRVRTDQVKIPLEPSGVAN
ncbi:MAG: hypothetical protein AMXMBFR22_12840 [Phycisphaerae bacterium]